MNKENFKDAIYVREIRRCCEFVQIAFEAIRSDLANQHPDGASRVFLNAHSIVIFGNHLWKLLGRRAEGEKKLRAERLRAEIKVDVESLEQFKKLRNHLEHFDERLDEHLRNNDTGIVDSNISNGPLRSLIAVSGALYLRNLDSSTLTFAFVGEEYHLATLLTTVERIRLAADAWLEQTQT